jgi:hypothetical protein
MTDTITSQNTEFSSWITLYIGVSFLPFNIAILLQQWCSALASHVSQNDRANRSALSLRATNLCVLTNKARATDIPKETEHFKYRANQHRARCGYWAHLAYAWLSNWNVSVKFLPSLQQNFTHTHTHTHTLLFKLFHCHFVTNPTNMLCTCSVQQI